MTLARHIPKVGPALGRWCVQDFQAVRRLRIPRIENQDFPVDRPCLVNGLTASWRAHQEWRFESLMSNKYKDRLFQCGVNRDTGEPEVMAISDFLQLQDTSIQVFDPAFESDCPEMLDHYTPPLQVQGENDLLHLLDPDRPDFRWFLLGLKGSGTPLHIDPLCSSAWNSLVSGRKKWIIFPERETEAKRGDYEIESSNAHDLDERSVGKTDGAVGYFNDDGEWRWSESIQSAAVKAGRVFEFEQVEGETVVVPAGHQHAVANMEDSVAITHNFVTADNVPASLRLLAEEAPDKAALWEQRLAARYPRIART